MEEETKNNFKNADSTDMIKKDFVIKETANLINDKKAFEDNKKAFEEAKLEFEQKQSQLEARFKEIEEREKAITLRERRATTQNLLAERGLDTRLVDFVNYSNEEGLNEMIDSLDSIIKEQVENGITERIRTNTPKAAETAISDDDAIRAEVDKLFKEGL